MSPRPRLLAEPSRDGAFGPVPIVATVILVLVVGGSLGGSLSLAPAPGIPADPAPIAALSPPRAALPSVATLPIWVNVSGGNSSPAPPLSYGGSVAWDPVDQEYVYFGGCGAVACPTFNTTWTFAQGHWHNATTGAAAPPARFEASMAFDAHAQGVLLFGGYGAAGYLNDTWLFHGGLWTNETGLGPAPPARTGAALAFDADPQENGTVLFGGCGPSGCDNSTYVWTPGAGWTSLPGSATHPPARELTSMTYDAADHYLVLFGGDGPCSAGFCEFNDTWELYSGTWWAVHPSLTPPALEGHALSYDAALGEVVLFGGYNATLGTVLNQTWLFSAGAWTMVAPVAGPPGRALFAMTVDATGAPPLLFSGLSAGNWNDTWVYAPLPSVSLSGPAGRVAAATPLSFAASVTGGTGPFSVRFEFGDSTTQALSGHGPAFSASHAYAASGNYTVRVNVTDAVGLVASATVPVTVGPGPGVAIRAEPPATDVGRLVVLSASLVGGTAPATFAWTLGDGASATGPTTNHSYSAPGIYRVAVNATDAAGGVAEAELSIAVAALLDVNATLCVGLACGASAAPVAGTPVQFSAEVTGGTPNFTYAWAFGDGAVSSAPSPLHTFAVAGTYTCVLWVNDSVGDRVSLTGSVVVGPAAPGPAPGASGSPPVWFWAGLAAILVVGAVGGVLLLRRRRASPPP